MSAKKQYHDYVNNYNLYMSRRRTFISIALCVVLLWYKLRRGRLNRPRIKYGPWLPRHLERQTRLNRLYNNTEAHCISELRMQKVVFHRLCDHLKCRGLFEDFVFVSTEEQVAMFMHFVGHRWTNRSVGIEFLRSGETMRRYFHAVLDAIGVLSSNLIISTSTKTHPKILNSSRFHLYFEVIYNTCT
jgi:hypothetical protein